MSTSTFIVGWNLLNQGCANKSKTLSLRNRGRYKELIATNIHRVDLNCESLNAWNSNCYYKMIKLYFPCFQDELEFSRP